MSKHDTIYNALLGALGFLLLLSGASMLAFSGNPNLPADGRWVFRMSVVVAWMYALAAAVTLVVRFKAPAARRPVTMAMNIVLLIYFPLGTALGIYGLWKADRSRPPPPIPREG